MLFNRSPFNTTLFNRLLYIISTTSKRVMLLGDFNYTKTLEGRLGQNMENQNFTIHEGDDDILDFYIFDEDGVLKDVTGYSVDWGSYTHNRTVFKSTGNSNISIDTSKVSVTLDSLDTIDYDGIWSHELRLTDTNNKTVVAATGTMTVLKSDTL